MINKDNLITAYIVVMLIIMSIGFFVTITREEEIQIEIKDTDVRVEEIRNYI
ncbi:MAG: hypothetical protein ACRC7N_06885 [Clostridium sp.]